MLCPACASSNDDDARFCTSCGAPLARAEDAGTSAGSPDTDPGAPTASDPPAAPGSEPETAPASDDRIQVPVGILVGGLIAAVIVGALAFIVFRGNGDPTSVAGEPYPQEVRTNFMQSCTSEGAPASTCTCMIDAIEDRISLEEFIELESRIEDPNALPQAFVDAITSCL